MIDSLAKARGDVEHGFESRWHHHHDVSSRAHALVPDVPELRVLDWRSHRRLDLSPGLSLMSRNSVQLAATRREVDRSPTTEQVVENADGACD